MTNLRAKTVTHSMEMVGISGFQRLQRLLYIEITSWLVSAYNFYSFGPIPLPQFMTNLGAETVIHSKEMAGISGFRRLQRLLYIRITSWLVSACDFYS